MRSLDYRQMLRMVFDPRRDSIIQAVGIATVALSITVLAVLLFSVW